MSNFATAVFRELSNMIAKVLSTPLIIKIPIGLILFLLALYLMKDVSIQEIIEAFKSFQMYDNPSQ